MTNLRGRLKKAADWAALHARHGQEVYTHNYNRRSRDKRFDDGDKVIVLDDDATGKLCKRWQGPATVVRASRLTVILLIWATAVFVIYMQIRCVNFMCVCRVVT